MYMYMYIACHHCTCIYTYIIMAGSTISVVDPRNVVWVLQLKLTCRVVQCTCTCMSQTTRNVSYIHTCTCNQLTSFTHCTCVNVHLYAILKLGGRYGVCVIWHMFLDPLPTKLNILFNNNKINPLHWHSLTGVFWSYIHVHTCTYIHVYMYVYIYNYVCIQTELHVHVHVHVDLIERRKCGTIGFTSLDQLNETWIDLGQEECCMLLSWYHYTTSTCTCTCM